MTYPVNQIPIKIQPTTSTALDINVSGDNYTFFLDQSSYIWVCGGGNSTGGLGNGTFASVSSPVPIIADRHYVRFISGGTGALDASSYAWIWGSNVYGEMGINDGMAIGAGAGFAIPRSAVGGKQWIALYGTGNQFMGLDSSSYLWSWGLNSSGQIGDNTNSNRSSPTSVVGGRQFIKMSLCVNNACGLDKSSYAWAWGDNTYGQVGTLLATPSFSSPVSVVGSKQFIAVEVGTGYVVALDGSSYAWMWGNNAYGQIGDQTTKNRSSPISVLSTQWNKIFAGGQGGSNGMVFGFKGDGVYAWGYNNGQYGTNTLVNYSVPTKINFPVPVTNINKLALCKNAFSFSMLDTSSNTWQWGSNTYGNFGVFNTNPSFSPVKPIFSNQSYSTYIAPMQSFIQVIITSAASYALDTSSYAWAWGNNGSGQLGDGTTTYRSSPVSIVGNVRFKSLIPCPSGVYCFGLDISSYAWSWGNNPQGMLGNNSTQPVSSPVKFAAATRWLKLVNCNTNGYGIDQSSQLWSWGYNYSGQLGNGTDDSGTPTDVSVPTYVTTPVLDVICSDAYGQSTTAAYLDNHSYAWTFGYTYTSLLGNGDDGTNYGNQSYPTSVIGGRQFIKLLGNNDAFYGLNASSYLWAWGLNTNGAIGDNTTNSRSSPVSVVGSRRFIIDNIHTFSNSSYIAALDASSYLWVWGANFNGYLGDGTANSRSSPISVIGTNRFNSISLDANGFTGVTSYPNSQCICTGLIDYYSGYPDYLAGYFYYVSPIVVTFGPRTFINTGTIKSTRKKILGK